MPGIAHGDRDRLRPPLAGGVATPGSRAALANPVVQRFCLDG
ncbi:MAG TPA: hypothetical protein VML50_10405 [Anaeromyxobacter sp.]|nr:hypothetical protein [Anaeromyxobacter sp.]